MDRRALAWKSGAVVAGGRERRQDQKTKGGGQVRDQGTKELRDQGTKGPRQLINTPSVSESILSNQQQGGAIVDGNERELEVSCNGAAKCVLCI